MNDLDVVLQEFRQDVQRVHNLLSLVKSFRVFAGSSSLMVAGDSGSSWREADDLHEASKQTRTDLPLLSGSLQLYLAGRFEYFARQTVEIVATEVANKAKKYLDLPEPLRAELKSRTLELQKEPRRFGYDELQADALLCSLVAVMQSTSGPLQLNAAVLSITEANMKDRMLADLMKRVGVREFWKDVGKQATMKIHLQTGSDGETTSEAQNRLNQIMDERNQVAHPTGTTSFPDLDQVLKAADYLVVLAAVCSDLVRVYLATYRPTAAAPSAATA